MIIRTREDLVTPDDLLTMPDAARYELTDGHLVERNVSALSSLVEGYVYDRVWRHAFQSNAGLVWPGTMGYTIIPGKPEKVRKPDMSFIAKERLPKDILYSGYISIAPDLAAEVLSPNDSAYEVDLKIEEYFQAGVRLLWIINPETKTVTVCRPDGNSTKLHEHDTLDGDQVLPGFQCLVRELFPDEQTLTRFGLA